MRNSMPWSRTSQHQFNIKHSSIGHPKAMVLITSSLIWTHSLKSNFSMFSRLRLANKDMKSSAMTFLALFSFRILKMKKKNQFHEKILSNSNSNTDYCRVWKSNNFSATLILREINFRWFEKVKNCHFNIFFWGFQLWFFWKSHTWKRQKFPIIQNSEPLKMAFLETSKWLKLISRKISVAEKS